MDPQRRIRLALAALAFGPAATVAYLAQRLVDRARGSAVDPLSMLDEPHVAFYWRCVISLWWGGFAALAAYALSARKRRVERAIAWLALAAIPVGVLHVTLSWLLP